MEQKEGFADIDFKTSSIHDLISTNSNSIMDFRFVSGRLVRLRILASNPEFFLGQDEVGNLEYYVIAHIESMSPKDLKGFVAHPELTHKVGERG